MASPIKLTGITVDAANNVFYQDAATEELYEVPASGGRRTIAGGLYGYGSASNISIDTADNLYISYEGDSGGAAVKIQLGAVDLGKVNVCSASATTPAPCTNSITLNFNVDAVSSGFTSLAAQVVTQGGANLDYTAKSNTCTGAFPSSGTCSVTIQFAPLAPGTRLGAIDILGATTASPTPSSQANVYLHGTGLAPQGAFDAAPISTLPIALLPKNFIYGLTVAANGDLYLTDEKNCVLQKYSGSTLSVVAGTGTCASGTTSGDGSAATNATFSDPYRVAVDGVGNIYVVDNGVNANNVRRIDALTGIISTVAGSGSRAYTADGALAAGSALNGPQAIAVDGAGNLYIAEVYAAVIRKVDARTGLLSTVAGNHQAGHGYSGDNGPATSAQLAETYGLAFDSFGNLFIADDGNNAIRKVSPSGVITTIAGRGNAHCGYSGDGGQGTSAELCDPESVAVDAAGNVYIADASNNLIRKVNAATGIITTVAGVYNNGTDAYSGDGGSALKAGLSYLEEVAIDNSGNLLIADSDNGVIREVATGSALADFDTTTVGSTTTAQDLTFTNDGNSALALSAITLPTDFNVSGADTSCTASTTLALGTSCVLGVKFLPTVVGSLTDTITLTDNVNNNPASTQSVALTGTGVAIPPTKLALAGVPPTIAAGGNLGTVTVSVEASSGAIITSSTTRVTTTITGPGGYSQAVTGTAVNGVATFNLSAYPLTTSGIYKITASSSELTSASATSTVTAVPVAATKLALAGVPPTIAAGGNLGTVTVSVEASSGAVVTGSTASVTATITGPNDYSQVVTGTAVNGVATFNLSAYPLTTAGTYTVTASSTGLAPASATSTVTAVPVAATKLALAGVPPTIAAGGNLGTVTVSVEASSGAVVTGSTASVTATITGPAGYSQTVTGTAVNGVATFNLSAYPLTTAGTYTVTASSTGLTPASATSTVTAVPVIPGATQMVVSAVPASVSQGGNLGTVTATLETAAGGVLTSPAATVTLTITGPGGFSAAVHAVTVNGVATFDLTGIPLPSAGSYSVVVSSAGLPSQTFPVAIGQDFTLAPAPGSTSGSGMVPAQTVQPGSPAVYPLVLAPAGTIFNAPITLTATGLPLGATYTFSPATITPGSASAATTLTVQTAKTIAALDRQNGLGGTLGGLALATLLLPFAGSRKLRRAAGSMPLGMIAFTLLSLGAVLGLTGCGAGGLFGHPPSTYTITVTGTSSSLSHSTTVNLTIQ